MTDSRVRGEPVPFGPEFQQVLDGFRVTLDDGIEPQGRLRTEVDTYDLKRRYDWDYRRVRCPRCDWSSTDEKHHCWVALEHHIHAHHGPELPDDHPLSRRTRAQKLSDWLDSEP